MTIDFICEELAELFDSPCNYSPMDEKMFQDSYCESHCGKVTDKECWKRYFEKVWADRKTEPIDKDINVRSKTEPQTCSVNGRPYDCGNCEYHKCTADEPQTETQAETQNSNLTFEKRTMRDCYNCKRYETEGECIECHYEPKDEPKICDTCRYYNSNIPCGSTPSACKEADKFAEEFVDGLKKLKPTISKMEQVDKDINVRSKTEPSFKVDGIGDDDSTIHAIAHLQKVGWLQEHDRALTEPQTKEWHDDCNTCRWHACTIPCCDYEPKTESQTERSE